MKKTKCVLLLLVFLLALVVGIPIIINESYKVGGYVTLWDAADVLGYYGVILGAIISITVLAVTIYYNRRQLVDEAKRQAKIKKWQMIEECANRALDEIHPFNLQVIASQAPKHSGIETLGEFLLYETNARRAVDKFRFVAGTENDPLIAELIEKMQHISEKCIVLQNDYFAFCRDMKIDQLGTQVMKKEGSEPELISVYQLGIFQKAKERSKTVLNELQEVYSKDYGPLIVRKTEIFTEIYQKIAQCGVERKLHDDS